MMMKNNSFTRILYVTLCTLLPPCPNSFYVTASTFPRVSVINLERHVKRRDRMIKVMSNENIPFEWCDAVDGSRLDREEMKRNATRLGRYFMTDGMIGCFLSHRKCWQRCVELNEPLLVFEDDVILGEKFRHIVSKALQALEDSCISKDDSNPTWDALLLGAMGCVHPRKKFGLNIIPCAVGGKWRKMKRIVDVDLHQNPFLGVDESFLHVPLCPYGMHAYIIHPRGAQKLLARFDKASYHVDVVAWGLKELEIIALHPLIAWQTNDDTTIGGLVDMWKKFLPTFIADKYTGFEIGWALSGPLLRVGGPLFPKLLLTTGSSLLIMFTGIAVGVLRHSHFILEMTLAYVFVVTLLVRLLSS